VLQELPTSLSFILLRYLRPRGILNRILRRGISFVSALAQKPTSCWSIWRAGVDWTVVQPKVGLSPRLTAVFRQPSLYGDRDRRLLLTKEPGYDPTLGLQRSISQTMRAMR
jgi:hypothetical protein